jgi:phosphatidylserine decarboxylase
MINRIHREGYKIIPISFLIILGLMVLLHVLLPAGWGTVVATILDLGGIVLMGLILNFFRNPHIDVKQNPAQILSPCDGKVVVIEEVEDTLFFNKKVMQISIFMSPLNVHVNRNPISGAVKMVKYFPGKFLVAFDPKSSYLNEQSYVAVENEHMAVAYKQIAGYVARRIIYYIEEGTEVMQGAEFGFIRFGSRIDILMPTDMAIQVKLGDVVKGGISVIAEKQNN